MDKEKKSAQLPVAEESTTIPVEEISKSMDKDVFFSAAMARQKTNTVHKKRLEVRMLDIYRQINEAISRGEYMINNIILDPDEKKFLSNKYFGFRNVTRMSNDKIKCTISWTDY